MSTLYKNTKERILSFNKYVLVVIIALVVILPTIFVFAFTSEEENTSQLASADNGASHQKVFEIQKPEQGVNIELTGTLRSNNSASVSSQLSGNVVRVYKKMGDKVESGELLAELEHDNLDAKISTLEKKHDASISNYESTKENTQAKIKSAKKAVSSARTKLESVKQKYRQKIETTYSSSLSSAQSLTANAVNALVFISNIQDDTQLNASLYDERSLAAKKGKAARILVGAEDAGDYTAEVIARKHSGVRGTLNNMEQPINNKEKIKKTLESFRQGMLKTKEAMHMMQSNIMTFGSKEHKIQFNNTLEKINSTISKITTFKENIREAEVNSRTAINNTKSALESAKQELNNAGQTAGPQTLTSEANKESVRSSIKELKEKRRDMYIRAPFTGTVAEKKIQKGDFARAGQKIFELVNMNSWQVKINVPDKYNDAVDVGSIVHASIDGVNGEHKGEIVSLSPIARSNTRKVRAKIVFDELPKQIKSGLFTRVQMPVSIKGSKFYVPNNFIQYGYEGPYLKTKRGDRNEVEIIRQNKVRALVSGKGLSEGVVIIK